MINSGFGGFAAMTGGAFFLAICVSLVVTARSSAAWFRLVMEASHIPMPRSRATAIKNTTTASMQMQGALGSIIASIVAYNLVSLSIRVCPFRPELVGWIIVFAVLAGSSAVVAVVFLIAGLSEGLGASATVRSRRRTIGSWVLTAFVVTFAVGSVLASLR